MLLLISGASGVGKTTARLAVAKELGDAVETVELRHLGPIPPAPTTAWRQEMVEVAVQRAIALKREGRHLLLAGDPIPAGEVLAAPSADMIDIAVCLLDADADSQTSRLRKRQDPEEMLVHHVAFANWMRKHATDPSHMHMVLTMDSWDPMRWDRWMGLSSDDPSWRMTVIDTSNLTPGEVALEATQWCQAALDGRAPIFRAGWWDPHNR